MSAFVLNIDSFGHQRQSSDVEDETCVKDLLLDEDEVMQWGVDENQLSNSEIKELAEKIADELIVLVKKQLGT